MNLLTIEQPYQDIVNGNVSDTSSSIGIKMIFNGLIFQHYLAISLLLHTVKLKSNHWQEEAICMYLFTMTSDIDWQGTQLKQLSEMFSSGVWNDLEKGIDSTGKNRIKSFNQSWK